LGKKLAVLAAPRPRRLALQTTAHSAQPHSAQRTAAQRTAHSAQRTAHSKGPAKSTKKGWGQIFFSIFFFIVFLNSRHRETPKNVIKKIEKKSVLDFWSNFL
jgi:hypothetical protein